MAAVQQTFEDLKQMYEAGAAGLRSALLRARLRSPDLETFVSGSVLLGSESVVRGDAPARQTRQVGYHGASEHTSSGCDETNGDIADTERDANAHRQLR